MNVLLFVYCTMLRTVTETALPMSYSMTCYKDSTKSFFKNNCNFIHVHKKITAFPLLNFPKLSNYQHCQCLFPCSDRKILTRVYLRKTVILFTFIRKLRPSQNGISQNTQIIKIAKVFLHDVVQRFYQKFI
jgi:hypothetical protein